MGRGGLGAMFLPAAMLALGGGGVRSLAGPDEAPPGGEPGGTESRDGGPGDPGEVSKWRPIEVRLHGPDSRGRGDPNPFAIEVDVVFLHEDGARYLVPAFYDGDGRGGLDGDVWKARFSADATGTWTFRSQSSNELLDGRTGSFTVTPAGDGARGFYRWGRLEPAREEGARYLRFRDGPWWLKAGCDDPENFLGGLEHYDTLEERKRAIDYLAARGINSLYVVTHNIDGDNRDVWPWLGETAREAKTHAAEDARFDVARLAEWRELFEHMQSAGVCPYVVLEDDSAWTGYDAARYYREVIARFGDLPALVFNIGEEHNENYDLDEALALARLLAETDPYDHPRGIHNVNRPRKDYLDAREVDFASIQTSGKDPLAHNRLAIEWLESAAERGRDGFVVGFDEPRPERDRRGWWSGYLGGALWEVHVGEPFDRPMAAWEPAWTELGGARAFLESLPFHEMEPRNDLVKKGDAFCLARPGKAYALYLPRGGSVAVELADGGYHTAWWDPTNGRDGRFDEGGVIEGGLRVLTAPGEGDRALRILERGFVGAQKAGQ